MPINFSQKIKYINSGEDIKNNMRGIDPLPDYCPVCKSFIAPHFVLVHSKWITHEDDQTPEIFEEVLCGCPRNDCNSLFFAVYQQLGYRNGGPLPFYELINMYPKTKINVTFDQVINDLSPEFIAIFNQAKHAEQENLDLICGVGYRKALEFLIKDYIISDNPNDKEKIKKMPIKQCVEKYIDYTLIKEMANRAIYVGNDETHYTRRHVDKDIKDLKNLIDLTVHYIAMNLSAKKYSEWNIENKL